MRVLAEAASFVGVVVIGVVMWGLAIYYRRPRQQSAPDKCKHKRWTKWKTEQVIPIHLYEAVDSGLELPDRVDAYMTRECLGCGLPQARTVRGVDSPQYK